MIISNAAHRIAWQRFVYQTGATDKSNLLAWCDGIYDLGLWANMVCWPLLPSQSVGSGTSVPSLGGLVSAPGTLGKIGATYPTWGTTGVALNGTNYMDARYGRTITHPAFSLGVVMSAENPQAGFTSGVPYAISSGMDIFTTACSINDAAAQSGARWFNSVENASAGLTMDGAKVAAADPAMVMSYAAGGTSGIISSSGATQTQAYSLALPTSDRLVLGGRWNGTSISATLGSYGVGFVGTQSLAFFCTEAVVFSDIYTLYKQTLGLGLNLP